MDSSAPRAVFLSYAHEDADAARRLAEALRSQSIEVWFDQSELRGGEAWDASIRKQIRDCALFVPVVSGHTQERREGYFRLEWKLADERTHLMAEGTPFILPVVVDGTKERDALVPKSFLQVQWTWLPHGEVPPALVERVRRLMRGGHVAGVADPGPASTRPATGQSDVGVASPAASEVGRAPVRQAQGPWLRARSWWIIVAAAVVLTGFFGWRLMHSGSDGVPPSELAARRSSPPTSPSAAAKPPLDFASAKSIAVLPFENMSPDKDNAFFADGVHEDVIISLGKVRDLKVIGRASVLAFRETATRDLRKIADELQVATVLTGTVRRVGSQVRVSVELLNARTGATLWSESFNRDVTDIFAIQSALAQEITGALKATLTVSERALIERKPTQNQEAYEFYLRGVVLEEGLSTRSKREKFDQVVATYEQAVARDPAFAFAYARLAGVQCIMYFIGLLDPSAERRARAQAALETAERLAPDAPEVRQARGTFSYYCDLDLVRAIAELQAAEKGLPNDATLLARIGLVLRRSDRSSESVNYLERAATLNPHHLYIGTQWVQGLFILRRFRPAYDVAQRYAALAPEDGWSREYLVRAQFALDGDRAAYLRARVALPPMDNDPLGLQAAYNKAIAAGDYPAVTVVLADQRLTGVLGLDAAMREPNSLHRAMVAFLMGDHASAQISAEEAITIFQNTAWTSRQRPYAMLGAARAAAYAGRAAPAIRDAQAVLDLVAGRDAPSTMTVRFEFARIYAALGHREEALAMLRVLLQGPSYISPNELRIDPFLSRLKVDPRFEEILKSAKPL